MQSADLYLYMIYSAVIVSSGGAPGTLLFQNMKSHFWCGTFAAKWVEQLQLYSWYSHKHTISVFQTPDL